MCLAQSEKGVFMRVDELSKVASVPSPYLSKIMKILAKKKLVETRRGLTGGVRLKPNSSQLSFLDVCAALGDPVTRPSCILSKSKCGGAKPCELHNEWAKVRDRLQNFLAAAYIS